MPDEIKRIQVTPEIRLESISHQHAEALFNLTDKNRNYLREWLPWLDGTQNVEDTRGFIDFCLTQEASGKALNYLIFFKSNSSPYNHSADDLCGSLCGTLGFNSLNRQHKIGQIGYWLDEGFQGHGIMRLTVRELIRQGFEEQRLNKIEIRCAEENTKSQAIPKALGFQQDGILRQNEYLYDRYVDHIVYSLLREDYF